MSHTLTVSNTQFMRILNELAEYKAQTKELKEELNLLESENEFNNQLLDEKSKHIISCTSENIVLRKEIESLKKKLKLLSKRKKTPKKSNAKQQLKLIFQEKQLSDKSTDSYEIHEIHENLQMPYLMSSMSSNSVSNQSAQARKVSLSCTPMLPTEIQSQTSALSIILNPIEESNENSADQFTFSPITPTTPILNESKNNLNIHSHEWSESIATISPQPTPKNMNESPHFVSDISLDADDEDSVISMSGESEMDYYEQQEEEEEDIDGLSYLSGVTNLIYVDYSDSDAEFPHKKQQNVYAKSNICYNNEIPIMQPNTNILKSNSNVFKADNNDECKYEFPRAISVLSELTDTDSAYQFD